MKNKKILLSPCDWWIGKKNGQLFVIMFDILHPDDSRSVCWDIVDESNLPKDLVRRDGEEYSFVIGTGLKDGSIIEKVGHPTGYDAPGIAADTITAGTGMLSDGNPATLPGSAGGEKVPADGP